MQVHKLAVSDVTGRIGMTSVSDGSFVLRLDDASLYRVEEVVDMTTLDIFVKDKGLTRLDGLKVDVEGAEIFVLKGAVEAIRGFKPIIELELIDWTADRFGYNIADIFTLLDSWSYRPVVAVNSENIPHSIHPQHTVAETLSLGFNIFFVHRDREYVKH
jgi:hypothetical protein